MKIFITIPSFGLHGGIRIILEWANRLAGSGHTVILRVIKPGCAGGVALKWFPLSPAVRVVFDDRTLPQADLLIVTSPHAANYLDAGVAPHARKVVFLQMMEHLFRPGYEHWFKACRKLYTTSHPLICISLWNWQMLLDEFGRTGPVHYVGNGVNLNHFPIKHLTTDNTDTADTASPNPSVPSVPSVVKKTVLIEGINGHNPTKDPMGIAARVGKRLHEQGYTVVSYGAQAIPVPWKLHWARPSLADLNALYERATILLKASMFDARACAPVEAMTKGVPTARAIKMGDDDLIHGVNCLKVDYEENALSLAAQRLLENDDLRHELSTACLEHVTNFSWDHWWPKIENILTANSTIPSAPFV